MGTMNRIIAAGPLTTCSVLIATLVVAPAQAACHLYSIWNYKTPQHCGVTHVASRAADKRYYVEITTPPAPTPAVKNIPLPAVEAIPEKDQRTPQDIQDQKEHDAAVQAFKGGINKKMILLHAEEDARKAAGVE